MKPPLYIDRPETLAAWLDKLSDAPVVAVDTESDSLHSYREKVCLIQMTALGEDALIDPLTLDSVEPLRDLLQSPSRTKIFHDAGYDLVCLYRDFGFEVQGVFDTMWASRLLGMREFGLAAILRDRYGVEANKRLQRSDWGKRPLTEEQISYARLDTHYLPRLADELTEELRRCGRLDWALEDFVRLPSLAARSKSRDMTPDPNGFWRIQGARALGAAAKGRLQALYLAREKIAARLDRPAFKVLNDTVLLELAKRPPRLVRSLRPRPGLRRSGIERFGKELFDALQDARPVDEEPPAGYRRRRRAGRILDPAGRDRYEVLRSLRKKIAESLGIEPEVALGNAVLDEVARRPPATVEDLCERDELAGWRRPIFARKIVEVCRRCADAPPQAGQAESPSGRRAPKGKDVDSKVAEKQSVDEY